MRFQDKVIFITGGARGLGKAMAKAFLNEGAKVAVNGRTKESLAKFEDEMRGSPVLSFEANVTDYEAMEATVQGIVARWGRIDVLINNAGIVNPLANAEKTKKDDFDKVIDVNMKGTFYTTQIVGRKMIEQGAGRIITVASQAALFGEKGFLPYSVSKACLSVMTRGLAYEWSPYGVTLCCIAPGFIKGGMNEGLIRKEVFADYLSKRTPLGRMGTVEELVETILFLASPLAQYINGETVVIDGGLTGYVQLPLLDMITRGK